MSRRRSSNNNRSDRKRSVLRPPRRNPSRGFRSLFMRMLAEWDRRQRWLANRIHVPIPAVNRIVNGRRLPTGEQVLRIAAGRVCTDDEMLTLAKLDEVNTEIMFDTGLEMLTRLVHDSKLMLEQIAGEASIAISTLRGFMEKRLKISDEEMVRLFLVVTVREPDRRKTINDLLEGAGDYVLGPVNLNYSCSS